MRVFLTLILLLASVIANAESIKHINGVISRGNRAYELSQRTRIKECADSASTLLDSGGFQKNDSLDLLASIYKLYGNHHYENSDFATAEKYYGKAQELIESNSDVHFASLTRLLLLRDMAQLYYRLENYSRAAELMALVDDEIEYNSPYDIGDDNWLITKLTYAICLARVNKFGEAVRIAETELNNAVNKDGLNYVRAQRMYAKILMLSETDRGGALNAYKKYFEKQKQEAMINFVRMDARQRNEYWQTLQPFIADCYRLEDADPGFLYDVTLFAKGLLLQLNRFSGDSVASRQALNTLSYKWSEIRKRLKPTEAAIEFIQYEKSGKNHLAALILNPASKPSFVSLSSPDEIMALAGDEMESTDRADKDKLYGNHKLHSLIWNEKLMNALAGAKRIYFAPDGYLHKLAIEYMPPVENLEMYRLTSTRRLMDNSTKFSTSSPTLFIGGVNYEWDKTPGIYEENDTCAYLNYIGKSFPRLSDSTNEAKLIYTSRKNIADTLIVASAASENTLNKIAANYESILISTHGDFCSSRSIPTDIKSTEEDETMSHNIIALAGVNSYLNSNDFMASKQYDGLLSAKEISHLNLANCKLFTLSACQSALGHISADGVYGIQRGLKCAGVDAMLLSLWNVNSEATALLMQSFYRHLSSGMNLREAFAMARNDLMTLPPDDDMNNVSYIFNPATLSSRPVKTKHKSFNAPQYLNAFILIDALD